MFSVNEVIDIAVQLEKNGERFYRSGAELVFAGELRELLQWLAEEEVSHREHFLEMKAKFQGRDEDPIEQLGGAILQSAVSDHVLSLDEVDCTKIETEADLVDIAISFEKDGIAFYEILQSFMSDRDALRTVTEIINEEKKHVDLLTERKRTLTGPEGSKKKSKSGVSDG